MEDLAFKLEARSTYIGKNATLKFKRTGDVCYLMNWTCLASKTSMYTMVYHDRLHP